MGNEAVARRYATALADVVATNGHVDAVKAELKEWEVLIAANAELHEVFGNPSIPHAKKEGVLDALIKRSGSSKTVSNFLRVLLQNGRLVDLPEINERFDVVLEERSGVVSGEVISARELADTQKRELEKNLDKLTGKKVKLNFEIDEAIIGGVVTRIGSTVYDGSVRTQLKNLKEQLLES
ncbi:MAG TPA: ATP synthase F1 subunit delta [Pyrinomonadaceae bacterium]|nr:ATP synthase F1 subunit delta [Pyrinomonadaceae bacterium]